MTDTYYLDAEGNRYRMTIAYKERSQRAKASDAGCYIDGKKLYVPYNSPYQPKKLGLTRIQE